MVEIIPAIIPQTLEEIQSKLERLKGLVRKVQIDFVDGKYAPTRTWPFNLEKHADFSLPYRDEFILEADLMIKHPEDFLEDYIAIGIKSFVIHVDSTKYLEKCIHNIKAKGLEIGLGIKPSIDIDLLNEFITEIDFVQFMGNDTVGYNGVELDRKVIRNIAHFHANHSFVPIQIDIGVNFTTAPELIRAGVSRLVSGSAVFSDGNVAHNIERLKLDVNI